MKGRIILATLALIVVGGVLYHSIGEYGSQRFIEGQRDREELCIHQMTSIALSDIRFHSKVALESLEQNSTETFNLSMVELTRDLSRLESNLVRSAMLIFPEDFPDNATVANMTKNDGCITFIEVSRDAVLNGTANIPAVREGLDMIHNFVVKWRENGKYPAEELLRANPELQRKCSALIPEVVGP
ncbi:hypothetical protein [Palaeococcus ferrophilus]|uniref:hypothetical protein n=1 Tax=Palaeococcus ferrophilus TaxID=83868 RepID=UPI00064F28BF|nr:hypothetical protein [Palaeococcus ferrophilus]